MMQSTFIADRDPLVSSVAVCVLLDTVRAAKLSFCIPFSALVKSLFSLQFLILRGELNCNSQIYSIVPICRVLSSSIRQIRGSVGVSSCLSKDLQAANS